MLFESDYFNRLTDLIERFVRLGKIFTFAIYIDQLLLDLLLPIFFFKTSQMLIDYMPNFHLINILFWSKNKTRMLQNINQARSFQT